MVNIQLSNFQYRLMIIACRLELDLADITEIIYYVELLFENGYHDDYLLDILNIAKNCSITNDNLIKDKFINAMQNLNLPHLTKTQAKLIITFDILFEFSIRPFYPVYFEIEVLDFYLFPKYHDVLIDTDDIKSHYLQLVEIYYADDTTNEEIDNLDVQSLYILCEKWINLHKSLIIPIINQFHKNLP